MPLFSSFRLSSKSRSRRARTFNTTAGEVLEVRRLLTNAAPTLSNITAENGEVTADVVDDGSGGELSVEVDLDNDGAAEYFLSVGEGDLLTLDVSNDIAPNQTQQITVTVLESPNDGSATLFTSYQIDAEGLSIAEVNIESLSTAPGKVLGTISSLFDGAIGELSVLYREVGAIDWDYFAAGSVGGDFSGDVYGANGQRDFEFMVANEYNGHTIYGAIATAYDVPGMTTGSGDEGMLDEDEDGLFSGTV